MNASLQKNVSSGPHAIHIAKREPSTIRTAVCRLSGHVSAGPSGVVAQSCPAIRSLMSGSGTRQAYAYGARGNPPGSPASR